LGGDGPAYARRRPRVGVLTAVAVVAIAGVVTAAVIVGKSRPATVPVTEATVYTATMNASSADVYAIYAFTSGNHKTGITVTESGPVSWSANQGELAMMMTAGGEVLDGINTTHYRALIPLSRLGVGTPAELLQAERVLGTSFIGVDYWIDSSDLLRQLRLGITALRQPSATTSSPGEVTVPLGTYPITFSVSLRLSRYGTPVHVVPPPPAQITSREKCVYSDDAFNCTS
jgi:hypothetical protein